MGIHDDEPQRGFLVDTERLKPGLIVFRRSDVKHRNWYCRIKVPQSNKYKTVSLNTPDINQARDKAFDLDADIRFRVKHEIPVFEKTFGEIAKEFAALQKQRADAEEITLQRWQAIDVHVRVHLVPYIGHLQIAHVRVDQWNGYPLWRKKNGTTRLKQDADGEGRKKQVSDGTVRLEMITFRSVMTYAAEKRYIRQEQVPQGKMPQDKNRREAFSPQEYRKLHTQGRQWVKKTDNKQTRWYRMIAYNFMLVMTNTGMRPSEARNLRWKDIEHRSDRHGRTFVVLSVRGKGKFRELIASNNVATYLGRVKDLSKAIEVDDYVFTTYEGKQCSRLYQALIESLLSEADLLVGPLDTVRSTYSFRHTYATFRLMEGTDIYFLAKQMGTSVKMIENYYGHIAPSKNAERILQGIPGWEPIAAENGETKASVNAGPVANDSDSETE